MIFTYESYAMLLKKLRDKGYQFKNYKNWNEADKTVILRHDIDFSLQKAVLLSEIEKDIRVVGAIYFILLSTNFYNVHSKEARECIGRIMNNGGNIGLHFDETQYSISTEREMMEYVCKEVGILSDVIGKKIDTVSMHRPSSGFLLSNMEFPEIINSYNEVYFKKMKYLSDSRRCWQEDVDKIIEQSRYSRLHILTHPFWYSEGKEQNLKQVLTAAMLNASLDYYDNMNNNFRDLKNEIERTEIEGIIYFKNCRNL